MTKQPLVSVICVCFNQYRFIEKAIESIEAQSYPNIEIIIVDDGSSDKSPEVIKKITSENKNLKLVLLDQNKGNCTAFNRGFEISNGDYIIDLAADDELLPERVEEGVLYFQNCSSNIGINFTDVVYIDEDSNELYNHYKRNSSGQIIQKVPSGYIYPDLLERYFISTPSMMMKREVLEDIGGYDENLSYEDFDFWIRTAKKFNYGFIDKILVRKRKVKGSSSTKQYEKNSRHLITTYRVCLKAEKINENKVDQSALLKRLKYEIKKSVFSGNKSVGLQFIDMAIRNSGFFSGKWVYVAMKYVLKIYLRLSSSIIIDK